MGYPRTYGWPVGTTLIRVRKALELEGREFTAEHEDKVLAIIAERGDPE